MILSYLLATLAACIILLAITAMFANVSNNKPLQKNVYGCWTAIVAIPLMFFCLFAIILLALPQVAGFLGDRVVNFVRNQYIHFLKLVYRQRQRLPVVQTTHYSEVKKLRFGRRFELTGTLSKPDPSPFAASSERLQNFAFAYLYRNDKDSGWQRLATDPVLDMPTVLVRSADETVRIVSLRSRKLIADGLQTLHDFSDQLPDVTPGRMAYIGFQYGIDVKLTGEIPFPKRYTLEGIRVAQRKRRNGRRKQPRVGRFQQQQLPTRGRFGQSASLLEPDDAPRYQSITFLSVPVTHTLVKETVSTLRELKRLKAGEYFSMTGALHVEGKGLNSSVAVGHAREFLGHVQHWHVLQPDPSPNHANVTVKIGDEHLQWHTADFNNRLRKTIDELHDRAAQGSTMPDELEYGTRLVYGLPTDTPITITGYFLGSSATGPPQNVRGGRNSRFGRGTGRRQTMPLPNRRPFNAPYPNQQLFAVPTSHGMIIIESVAVSGKMLRQVILPNDAIRLLAMKRAATMNFKRNPRQTPLGIDDLTFLDALEPGRVVRIHGVAKERVSKTPDLRGSPFGPRPGTVPRRPSAGESDRGPRRSSFGKAPDDKPHSPFGSGASENAESGNPSGFGRSPFGRPPDKKPPPRGPFGSGASENAESGNLSGFGRSPFGRPPDKKPPPRGPFGSGPDRPARSFQPQSSNIIAQMMQMYDYDDDPYYGSYDDDIDWLPIGKMIRHDFLLEINGETIRIEGDYKLNCDNRWVMEPESKGTAHKPHLGDKRACRILEGDSVVLRGYYTGSSIIAQTLDKSDST